ncbi:MAG: hypothetical protein ACHQ50_14900 [Fimbriimonadales bacterium]
MTTVSDEVIGVGRPLALVAEDNLSLRENTVRMLDRRGVAAIPVGSFQQAANALTVSPRVDVALLDIHLDPDRDKDDRGGIAIARLLRSGASPIKIIGYSGKFREDELSRDELRLFDKTNAKGLLSHADHVELWDICAEWAQSIYNEKIDAKQGHLEQLRRLYESEVPEVEVLRRLQMDIPGTNEFTAEGALGLAGYRVRMVQVTPHSGGPSRPFVVWEQQTVEDAQHWTNVEVYDYSELYSSGANEAEALESLAEYLILTGRDLDQAEKLSASEIRLKAFIDSLFA